MPNARINKADPEQVISQDDHSLPPRPTDRDLEVALVRIAHASRHTLMSWWQALNGYPPPSGLSTPFLRRSLAWHVQAQSHGGMPADLQRKLKALAADHRRGSKPKSYSPGTRILRDWNGTTHVVEVVETGFLYRGQHYRSLSSIAHAITGTRWSGPRFFGTRP